MLVLLRVRIDVVQCWMVLPEWDDEKLVEMRAGMPSVTLVEMIVEIHSETCAEKA